MVQDHFITLGGLPFHYREWSGTARRSTVPLILLHGLASQSHIFDLVAPLLARPAARGKNLRVIALDQRGHGESAKPDDGYDFETVACDLLALLDALKLERVLLAGHSWGGNVALYFAARHPDRVRGVVLIDGGFLDIQSNPEMTWERTAQQLAPPNFIGTPVDEFRAMLKQYAGKLWKPAFEKIVLENFEIQSDNTIRPRLSFERHMKILRALWELRPIDLYPRLACPALLLPAEMEQGADGSHLEHRRAQVETAARAIRRSRVLYFRNTVHDIPLHRPRKLANAIIAFSQDLNTW
jgi:pimeloyl-ACP methyl ester carboxylesterase